MHKTISLLVTVLVLFNSLFAQNNLAIVKFQEAEEAYDKGNYEIAISSLDEAEKILKTTNPKILHLRIISQAALIEKSSDVNFDLVESTRKNAATYLTKYGDDTKLVEKYTQIYKINEKLKVYPATLEEFEKQKAKKSLEQEEQRQAAIRAKDNLEKAFKEYTYFDFKLGGTVEGAKTAYPQIFKKTTRSKDGDHNIIITTNNNLVFAHRSILGAYVKNNIIYGYLGNVLFTKDDADYNSGKKFMNDLVSELTSQFGFSPQVEKKEGASIYTWEKDNKTLSLEFLTMNFSKTDYNSLVRIKLFDEKLL